MKLFITLSVVFGVVLLLCALGLFASYATYRMTFMRRRKEYDPFFGLDAPYYHGKGDVCRKMIESLCDIPYESVSITSSDGLLLVGRFYRGEDGAPLEIACHGYKSHPCRDFSGGAVEAIASGRSVLLIHQRAHNESEGRSISFGINESDDVRRWISWGINRLGEDVRILLTGISMGAATVIMAAGKPQPKNLRCVIADCPYSSSKDIICRVAKGMGYPPKLVYPFIRLGAKLFGGFDPDSDSPEMAIRSSTLPILIIHGEEDEFVPAYMSERIRAARPEGTVRVLFPRADHGMSYIVDREGYMGAVSEFLKTHLYRDIPAEGEENSEIK